MMETQGSATDTTMRIARIYTAPRARVWAAFTDADLLRRWYAPVEGWVVHEARADVRPGGTYEISFGPPDAEPIRETGTYVDVVEHELLAWEMVLTMSDGHTETTRTTVTFTEDERGTLVSVVEEGYTDAERTAMHLRGWTTMVEQLAELL